MKTFERRVLRYLRPIVSDSLDDTIQPSLLAEKLTAMHVDHNTVAWIIDCLTLRPQYAWLQCCRSDVLTGSTGVPQGTVLSPFLFTIYTSNFSYRSATGHGDSEDRDEEYRGVVENFISCADQNHLLLNIRKTKELVIDERRSKRRNPVPITIQGEEMEIVDSHKFLGVHLNRNLD